MPVFRRHRVTGTGALAVVAELTETVNNVGAGEINPLPRVENRCRLVDREGMTAQAEVVRCLKVKT